MSPALDPRLLEELARRPEIDVETRRPDGRSRRTTIWVVASGSRAWVRSVRGSAGRWYRDAIDRPEAIVHAGEVAAPVRLVPERDADAVAGVTEALSQKYAGSWSSYERAFTAEDALGTTLRIDGRSAS